LANVDFISGYPGLQDFILAGLMKLMGATVQTGHLWLSLCALVLCTGTFLLARKFSGPLASLIAVWMGLWASVFHWWSPNPGYAMEGFAMAALLVCFPVGGWVKAGLAGFLLSLGFGFKQSAVFALVGVAEVLVFRDLGRPSLNRIPGLCLWVLQAVPWLVFVAFRVGGNGMADSRSFLMLLPWTAIVIGGWTLLPAHVSNAPEGTSSRAEMKVLFSLAALGAGFALGSAIWLVPYVHRGYPIASLLHEILVRVPALIDRHRVPFPPFGGSQDLFLLAAALGVALTGKTRWNGLGRTLLTVAALMVGYLLMRGRGPLLYSRASHFSWVWFGWLSFFLGMGWLWACRDHPRRREFLAFTVFWGVYLAAGFPYPGNYLYMASLGAAHLAAVSTLWLEFLRIRPSRRPVLAASAALVLAVGMYQGAEVAQYRRPVDSPCWRGMAREDQIPLVHLASRLRRLPENETIATYPNLAYVLFLAGKTTPTFYPNFLGDDRDLVRFAAEIRREKIDWVVVNRGLFLPKEFLGTFFPDPGVLVSSLASEYRLEESSDGIDFYQRV